MRAKLDDEIEELRAWTTDGTSSWTGGAVAAARAVAHRRRRVARAAGGLHRLDEVGKVHQPRCISAKRIGAAVRVEVKSTDGFELCRLCFR